MSRIPIFIEVPEATQEANICAKASQMLLEQKVEPLGLATHLDELNDVLKTLRENGLEAAIFIVNTFKAKDIIAKLDPLMGESPAVYLRRGMYAGQSGLMDHLPDIDRPVGATIATLKNMTPRLTSIWTYGGKNVDQVAQRIVRCTLKFVADGNFRHYEIENQASGR